MPAASCTSPSASFGEQAVLMTDKDGGTELATQHGAMLECKAQPWRVIAVHKFCQAGTYMSAFKVPLLNNTTAPSAGPIGTQIMERPGTTPSCPALPGRGRVVLLL